MVSADRPDPARPQPAEPVSDQLEGWLRAEGPRTLGSLIHTFGEKSFAFVFIALMALPALPLPTGGVTHVLELINALVALQLIVGRHTIWLPERWKRVEIGGGSGRRFADALVKRIRWLERFSRPRLQGLVRYGFNRRVFGLIVLALTLAAFVAPPFSGLDTLPSLGIVVLSLGILLEDFLLAVAGVAIGAIGAALIFVLGGAAIRGIGGLL